MKVNPLVVAFALATTLGVAIVGVLVWNGLADSELVMTTAEPATAPAGQAESPSPDPGDPGDPANPVAPTGEAAEPSTAEPAPTPSPVPIGPAGSADIRPELIESAIAAAAANPAPPVLPTRNAIASELVTADLAAAGYDLTGIDITVFPAGSAPSFVLMTADESAPLLTLDPASGDTSGAELFFDAFVASPALQQFEVTNLVFQFSGVDDLGPFELTMLIALEDLRNGLATGADVSGQLAVQVERP